MAMGPNTARAELRTKTIDCLHWVRIQNYGLPRQDRNLEQGRGS